MLPFRIAFRFLRTSLGQSLLIVFGIGVGIGVVIFVQSILVSLQENTLNTVIGSSSHITLKAIKNGDPIYFNQAIKDVVTKDPRIKTVVPVAIVPAIYTSGTENAPLNLIGGDLRQLDTIYKLTANTRQGTASLLPGEIMVGISFSEKYGAKVGDNIQIKFPQGGTTTLRVSGIFDLGSAAFNETTAFVNIGLNAAKLGFTGDKYSQIQMQLVDPFKAKTIADSWSGLAAFSGVSVRNWQDDNKQIVTAVASQGYSGYMIETFVLIAVALGIASTLAISAVQKTRQIGILKAMGMQDFPAGLIFFWQAAMLGLIGSLAGMAIGIGLVYLFKLSPVPFIINVDWNTVASAGIIGTVVSLLSSFIPIRNTSRLDPIEVIQVPKDNTVAKSDRVTIKHGDPHDHSGPLLLVEGVGKVYTDGVPYRALEGVSFTLDRGEFASVVGQSGSGKSTLLNQIGLLDTPTEGTIVIDGKNTAAIGKKGRSILRNELIGFIFQFHYLLPEFSVIENVMMPAMIEQSQTSGAIREQALETLGYMGLADSADKNANDLSGGQKQRVAIARGLMNRPELMLADEPTGNLDTVNSKAVYDLFRKINRDWGTSFLIVTHDRSIAEQTDRILEVQDGHLVQDVATEYAKRERARERAGKTAQAADPASPAGGEDEVQLPEGSTE